MANAHRIVAHVAEEMAQAVYEEAAGRNNAFFALNQDRKAFVKRVAPTLIEEARGILASMLERPDVSQKEKDEIHEALCLDRFIPRGKLH